MTAKSSHNHHYTSFHCRDTFRLMLAQAGSSLCLIGFLFFIRVAVLAILNHPTTSSSSSSSSSSQTQQLLVYSLNNYKSEQDRRKLKADLRASLDVLEHDDDCASLLRCINYGLEINVRNSDDFRTCKHSFVKCKSSGLLHHLNKLLEAVDDVA